MFNKNFVVVVKANGKILREFNDIVRLPFGTEYSILLKNLDTRRAVVNVEVDGDDVLGGYRLIIDGNDEIELKRFVVNGDLFSGPKFKFIEKTEKISNRRGDKVSDGILRIEYQFEREVNGILKYTKDDKTEVHNHYHFNSSSWRNDTRPLFDTVYTTCSDQIIGCTAKSLREPTAYCSAQASAVSDMPRSMDSLSIDVTKSVTEEVNNAGITTYGEDCTQTFTLGNIGSLDAAKHVITLQLLGTNNDGSDITTVVTVKKKIVCKICGTINKAGANYCSECGTNIKY